MSPMRPRGIFIFVKAEVRTMMKKSIPVGEKRGWFRAVQGTKATSNKVASLESVTRY